MTFGKWLSSKREALHWTQLELATRVGVSMSYISALERDEPAGKYAKPRRVNLEKVDKLAKVLKVPVDEARLAAGYAPKHLTSGKPQTLEQLLEILEHLGIENVHFGDHDRFRTASPEELQEVLEAVQLAVAVTLQRQQRIKPHASTKGMSDRPG